MTGKISQTPLQRDEFPLWVRKLPPQPVVVLLVLLCAFGLGHLYFPDGYSDRYAYQLPLLLGISHGILVRRRVNMLRSLLVAVPDSPGLWRALGRPLCRLPWTTTILAALGLVAMMAAGLVGVGSAPPSALDFFSVDNSRVAPVRAAFLGIYIGLLAGSAVVFCRVATWLSSNRIGLSFPAEILLIGLLAVAYHHAWSSLRFMAFILRYSMRVPSSLMPGVQGDAVGPIFTEGSWVILMTMAGLFTLVVADGLARGVYQRHHPWQIRTQS
jgi:hypothetical protein